MDGEGVSDDEDIEDAGDAEHLVDIFGDLGGIAPRNPEDLGLNTAYVKYWTPQEGFREVYQN